MPSELPVEVTPSVLGDGAADHGRAWVPETTPPPDEPEPPSDHPATGHDAAADHAAADHPAADDDTAAAGDQLAVAVADPVEPATVRRRPDAAVEPGHSTHPAVVQAPSSIERNV